MYWLDREVGNNELCIQIGTSIGSRWPRRLHVLGTCTPPVETSNTFFPSDSTSEGGRSELVDMHLIRIGYNVDQDEVREGPHVVGNVVPAGGRGCS